MPDPLTFVVLCLAAYRATRLAGWDDFPLAAKIRAAVIGERWLPSFEDDLARAMADPITDVEPVERLTSRLPGKQPSTEVKAVRPVYDRPMLAHLLHCPFCAGWWISLVAVAAWYAWHPVVYGMLPFAVSGAVGLTAKNLDP